VLNDLVANGKITKDQRDRICAFSDRELPKVMSETNRAMVSWIRKELPTEEAQRPLRGQPYNRADAPVSYPFL
jgi:hypothetical protein